MDLWGTIAKERQALADDLSGLNDTQWKTQSLCDDWTVLEVLAHMSSTPDTTAFNFLPKLAGAGFSLNKLSAKEVARISAGGPASVLAKFKSSVSSRKAPPGPKETWLGEAIVHGEDIRRPLGIKHSYADEALAATAAFYMKSNLVIGGKKRAAGLTLKATDTNWSAGSGPEVSGPFASIVIAIAGRKAGLEDLSGSGVEVLSARF
jgi:uncharacterized protein (TIGR03083 family)